ncbi:hypothetical protein KSP40_PGU010600 [Platanthera guangdongensis]|uniref:Cysteine-rich transmembrane domain-containing protein n=1 Tax=Platanthera guangdongensis TaxID=2320717 RepID=A0ABR2M5S9_9ASPA
MFVCESCPSVVQQTAISIVLSQRVEVSDSTPDALYRILHFSYCWYPTTKTATEKKKKDCQRTKNRGEKGFIEGCIAALCCCWLCEECCI